MRGFVVCAVVAAAYLLYMRSEDYSVQYSGANPSSAESIARCVKDKRKTFTGRDASLTSAEELCAREVGRR